MADRVRAKHRHPREPFVGRQQRLIDRAGRQAVRQRAAVSQTVCHRTQVRHDAGPFGVGHARVDALEILRHLVVEPIVHDIRDTLHVGVQPSRQLPDIGIRVAHVASLPAPRMRPETVSCVPRERSGGVRGSMPVDALLPDTPDLEHRSRTRMPNRSGPFPSRPHPPPARQPQLELGDNLPILGNDGDPPHRPAPQVAVAAR